MRSGLTSFLFRQKRHALESVSQVFPQHTSWDLREMIEKARIDWTYIPRPIALNPLV